MDTLTGLALLACFLVVVVTIIRGQSPVIMLLVLAIVWSVIAGIDFLGERSSDSLWPAYF